MFTFFTIKIFIQDKTNLNKQTHKVLKYQVFPMKVKLLVLIKEKSGSREIYKTLNNASIVPTSQLKYSHKGCCFPTSTWEKYYSLPFRILKDPTLQWFQYQSYTELYQLIHF